MTALCSDYDAGIDPVKLADLAENGTPLERDAAYLITRLEEYRNEGGFSDAVTDVLHDFYITAYTEAGGWVESVQISSAGSDRSFRERIDGLICEVSLFYALKELLGAEPQMNLNEFRSVASKWDIATNGLNGNTTRAPVEQQHGTAAELGS